MFFIKNNFDLENTIEKIRKSNLIAVDTEFERQETYFPILALIQINDRGNIYIIDPLLCNVKLLKEIFMDENILKIFHSSFQDVICLRREIGIIPKNIFDTQIAAAICGLGSMMSYQNLCKKLLDIEIDKSYQFSNWLKRPLSDKQIEYASLDVKHLPDIYEILMKKFSDSSLRKNLNFHMKNLSSKSKYKNNIVDSWKKIKISGARISENMKILASLREEYAINKNLIRKKILSDKDLLLLSEKKPISTKQLKSLNLKILPDAKFHQKITNIFLSKFDHSEINNIESSHGENNNIESKNT